MPAGHVACLRPAELRLQSAALYSVAGHNLSSADSAPHLLPTGAPSAEVAAAHWRALQSLAQLAAAANLPAASHSAALQALQQLAEGSLQSMPQPLGAALDLPAALVPGLQQLQVSPSSSAYLPNQVGGCRTRGSG